jgi:gliding motility-associated-like protein
MTFEPAQTCANPCQNVFTYTYTKPGTYSLAVLYQSIGQDDIQITVDENITPTYEIYACSNNRVTVKVTDNHYDQYVIDFNNDGTPENVIPFSNNAVASHAYGTPGTYNISVRGRDINSADNCNNNIQSFTTLATLPAPAINSIRIVDNTSVEMTFADISSSNIQYRLEIGVNSGSNFQVVRQVYKNNTVTVGNLLTADQPYCFRLSAFDPCTNSNTYSNIVCSPVFHVDYVNAVNRLVWRAPNTGINSVEILRNGELYSTIPGFPDNFDDFDYDCNEEYCYQIVFNYASGARSTSQEECGIGIFQIPFPAVENIGALVDRSGVALDWVIDPAINVEEISVLRAPKGQAPVLFNTTTNLSIRDDSYTSEQHLCYQISYRDQCNNVSLPGVIACPMVLTGDMNAINVVTINWTPYTGWKNGVLVYTIEKYNKDGALITRIPVGTDTTFVDDQADLANQVVTYRIVATAVDIADLPTSNSNTVTFTKQVNLTFPTAFTPGNDALNETFAVNGQYIARMKILIFDRWGALIFSSDNNEPWNGTKAGVLLPESTYVWRAQITDLAGQSISREGTLMLLRKN